jgi:hypothetical protein
LLSLSLEEIVGQSRSRNAILDTDSSISEQTTDETEQTNLNNAVPEDSTKQNSSSPERQEGRQRKYLSS